MEERHVGVRELVEFTLHGEDIAPAFALRAMQDGTLGHKARQKVLKGEGWESEVPVSCTLSFPQDGLTLVLAGRMDAFRDGPEPVVEEIKLWQGHDGPDAPIPAHTAQALCYAHMLFLTRHPDRVFLQIAYVSRTGTLRGLFREELSPAECASRFQALLEPYLRHMHLMRAHRASRDAELASLAFPFPAYRAGQRDYAVQVYTAIARRRRLFASMPTGTGKSAATLFPALKALGQGRTGQVFYLTARNTQRSGPLDAIARMRPGLHDLWVLILDAKDRQCPESHICHPDFCPRAKGHFLRDRLGIDAMMDLPDWSPEAIRTVADRFSLCPFELSLSLCEIADLVVCDYNYALDPSVRIQRVFDVRQDITLLMDEAHNLPGRIRSMLSGELSTRRLSALRRCLGKAVPPKHPLLAAMSALRQDLLALVASRPEDGHLVTPPAHLIGSVQELASAYLDAQSEHLNWGDSASEAQDFFSDLFALQRALSRSHEDYAFLLSPGKLPEFQALCLNAASHFSLVTQKLCGTVAFSATLDPLEDMKRLLGGGEEDACFSVPSPFPRENLLLVAEAVNVRYAARESAQGRICSLVRSLLDAHAGKYLMFLPSFAFLHQVRDALASEGLPPEGWVFQAQSPSMEPAEREAFLAPYTRGTAPVLSLCVLGGLFAEGIDLPGSCLDGAVIVGVGLPQLGPQQDALKDWYESRLGSGFLYAYQIPGMQKVAQAAGRVIRSETDRGVVLLIDDRFLLQPYRRLAPPHWHMLAGQTASRLASFWAASPAKDSPEGTLPGLPGGGDA